MRHPIHSTHIPEIDEQHRKIDELVERYRNASRPAEEQQILMVLRQVVQTHFQFLEIFFDVKFPKEFKQRQGEILDLLSQKIRQRISGVLAQEDLAAQLKKLFLLNISVHENKFHPPKQKQTLHFPG